MKEGKYETFTKHDTGKASFSILCDLVRELGIVNDCMEYGARKYTRDNWKLGSSDADLCRYKSAAVRHVLASLSGESIDKESGLSHMSHAVTNCLFVMYLEQLRSKEPEVLTNNNYKGVMNCVYE